MGEEAKRYAVVTGSNKGLGYGICKKLASSGIIVVLTARNEKRGLKAVESLKDFGLSDLLVFHQLDVTDPASIASLADLIKTQFGKLDILKNESQLKPVIGRNIMHSAVISDHAKTKIVANLSTSDYNSQGHIKEHRFPWLKVNNAALPGGIVDGDALIRKRNGAQVHWNEIAHQSYELAEECVEINFYGAERVTEALLPLLHLSTSPRIVNVSSQLGLLKFIPNEWARGVFTDIENLTRERLDNVLKEFLKDYKEGSLESKGWPNSLSGYTMSKAALNAYTRKLAKKCPRFRINSICPGYVKTDMNQNTGLLSIDEGAESPVKLALLPDSGPSGLFFYRDQVIPF